MFLFIRLINESFLFAWNAVKVNKLRTLLTLLGITIGIFAVISVLTIFDSMERYVRQNIESLGDNVLFIRKWPQFSFDKDYPWWEYWKRPELSMNDLDEIKNRSYGTEYAVFLVSLSKPIEYKANLVNNPTILGVSHDYNKAMQIELQEGRYFTPIESKAGRGVVILGSEVAEKLFYSENPVGKSVKVFGRKLEVLGIIKKEGENNLGEGTDNMILIPVNFIRNIIDITADQYGGTIIVKGKPQISNLELKDEITGIMRSVRKLKPSTKDDFTIEEITLLKKMMETIFTSFSQVGWIIGGFSLLVGMFGIANIMFVSVRERTKIIGIQKSLGAKNFFIMFQFLFEAVFLSLFGGLLGLVFVWVGALIFSKIIHFTLVLTFGNIIMALVVSTVIGLLAGVIPAWIASKMNPVEAIRVTG